jgi:hypothetical protein
MAPPKGHRAWNAGTSKGWLTAKGYREIRVNGRVVKEHRHIMRQHLGRDLLPSEDVHHVNGDKTDNRVENLQVINRADHSRITNARRTYKRGYKLDLPQTERDARSERMRNARAEGKAS